ncbi:topless-related protein 2-like isoform X4 [Durio zibethinus]|uniref:Topless-related protein 2-like isoform X4 n=1 Tax=Durio zibethinus TaxID=66656 RepID=A0A6P5X4A4_DURZI|nr:topless-related protein 2-like isoform X4 [Durio zibethinus]
MSSLNRELVFLILQFLEEEKFKETVHRLEQESGFFFNMKYLEEKALAGEWDEVEKYLSGFTKVDDNRYSMKIFFEIRKQKYLEALDGHDRAKAVEILVKDLKVFSTFNEELYKEITQLLTLENFRENEQLSKYGDTKSARSIMLVELKKLIEENPLFWEKLVFPTLKASRLRTLINQSLNWQHQLCKNPRPNPDIKTLFTDHSCSPPNGARAPTPVTLPVAAVAKASTFASLGAPGGPFPSSAAAAAAKANALVGWMANANHSSSVQPAVVAASASSLPVSQNQVLKHPRTPSNTLGMIEYGSTDHEQLMKRLRSAQFVDEVTYPPPPQQASWSLDDLPRSVACAIHQGSNVTSMDFHPSHHTLLTVGCSNGEISLWEVGMRERLVSKPFKIWNMSACSVPFQANFVKDSSISVSRVAWSPDGNLIGVAFTKHLVHLHAYRGSNDLRLHLEIDAHVGGVNDLAFSHPNKKLCVVTCGDDKLIKVWDLAGNKLFHFEGHEAPVYSVCPHQKENIQFIFSTAVDGKIKAWLYDNMGSRVDYDAPGQWCTTMLYTADGSRLFSCGTSKDGDSFLVEWNGSEGKIKRSYSGFRKNSTGVVQFDTTRNHFLAVGDDSQIKFWDMDNTNILTSTEAEGGLPSLPRLRFNKEGNLLVVTTADNGFKVLGNSNGLRALRAMEARSYEASRTPLEMKVSSSAMGTSISPVVSKVEHVDSPARPTPILATASIVPQHWQPNSGLLMTNDVPDNTENAIPCIALSKNDSYVMSACGGQVSVFNMMTFKVMITFMPPPPASTFLAFHPQDNNIIAIGMEDTAIHIYNVRVAKVKTKLKGHEKHITGLAFSNSHNILVSSGADAQLFFWNADNWEKIKSVALQLPTRKAPQGDTRVQFYSDQVRLLVCHETQLAVYDANKMEQMRLWMPQEVLSSPISSAACSCNSQLVYATFTDGNIGIFDADSLRLRCRIAPSAYISPALSNSQTVHPLVVTAHPQEANQLAVGLTDGSVKVIEPSEAERKWGLPVPVDNGAENGRMATSSTNNTSEQLQR